MVRSVSIRRSLLVNLVAVITILGVAIIVTVGINGRIAVRRLSGAVIIRTAEQVAERLHNFFDPVAGELLIARSWGETGLLDLDQPDRLDTLLEPIMREYRQISSIEIADARAREYMLLREGSRWTRRMITPGQRAEFSAWTDERRDRVITTRHLDYDPIQRPWYRGAVNYPGLVHWTEPYTFFTTQQPGITASVAFDPPDDGDAVAGVIACDVRLIEISNFTYRLRPSRRGIAFVMTEQGQVIGLPHDDLFATVEAREAAMLRPATEVGVQPVHDGTAAYFERDVDDRGAYRFTSGGRTWWAGARQFELGPSQRLLIAVGMPWSDLVRDFARLRWMMTLITVAVLGGAIWRVAVLARRYSRPIEALVAQSRRISRGNLEPAPPVASNVTEVRRLAAAHERMRLDLQTLMKLERDIQLARQIQESTFPDQLPKLRGFQIDAWSEPADETGGDTFDIVGYRSGPAGIVLTIEHPDRALLLMADATGHGIGPAISVTQVRAMLRMAVRLDDDPATIVRLLNDQLFADLPEGRFITAWLGELDAAARTLTSFSAGQGPILHYRATRKTCDVLPADTVPLGVVADIEIDIAPPATVEPGDIIAVISDGIFEASDRARNQFGTDRVTDLIVKYHDKTPSEIIAILRDEVRRFTDGLPADDDRTGIIIKG